MSLSASARPLRTFPRPALPEAQGLGEAVFPSTLRDEDRGLSTRRGARPSRPSPARAPGPEGQQAREQVPGRAETLPKGSPAVESQSIRETCRLPLLPSPLLAALLSGPQQRETMRWKGQEVWLLPTGSPSPSVSVCPVTELFFLVTLIMSSTL